MAGRKTHRNHAENARKWREECQRREESRLANRLETPAETRERIRRAKAILQGKVPRPKRVMTEAEKEERRIRQTERAYQRALARERKREAWWREHRSDESRPDYKPFVPRRIERKRYD